MLKVHNMIGSLNLDALTKYFPLYGTPEEYKDLSEYCEDLHFAAQRDFSIQLTNRGKVHATCVMATIFEKAYNDIKIFADSFKGDISDNPLYTESLKSFLDKSDSKISVLFCNSPNPNSKALELLRKQEYKHKVKIATVCRASLDSFRSTLADPNMIINFTVANNQEKGYNIYRCETDTKSYRAFLNFDDPIFANSLLHNFSILEKNSKPV